MERTNLIKLFFVIGVFVISSCGKDDSNPNGFVEGNIYDMGPMTGIGEVLISVFDSNTNQPVFTTKTDAEGAFNFELLPGSYYMRLSKQSYQDVPPVGISPVPFNVVQGATEMLSYEMLATNSSSAGWISGVVTDGSAGVPGALIVAESAEKGYSAYSDQDGHFYIFNVPSGSYDLKGWLSGYDSDQASASVSVNVGTEDVQLTLADGASGVFQGQIKNLATENKDVDIALVHPKTRQTIPGLITKSSSQVYEITNVPAGTYIARATFENDQRVMDPDRIAKFGEPEVSINGNTIDLSFDITNCVSLNTPTNEANQVIPVELFSTTPTFEWTAYSSTSDYVIEVADANGNVIWGGFSEDAGLPVKNVTVPSSQLSAEYNFDGSASVAALQIGQIYRWRVYASKDDTKSETGWTLISASEDQRGIFKVIE